MGKRILIIGERVHNVGYRPLLLALASSLGIKRFFADNIEFEGKQAVEVLIEGKEEDFLELIKQRKPKDAVVSDIKVEDYEGYIMDIESYNRYLTGEQLTKIAGYGRAIMDELKLTREELGRKIEDVGRKVDKVGEKVDKVADKVDQAREELGEKIEEVGKKVDRTREELGEKIDGLRADIKTSVEERLRIIEEDIRKIKAKLGMT